MIKTFHRYLCMKFSRYGNAIYVNQFRGTLFLFLFPVFTKENRQPPIFPRRLQRSTFGRFRLNHRVRDVERVFLATGTAHKSYDTFMSLILRYVVL